MPGRSRTTRNAVGTMAGCGELYTLFEPTACGTAVTGVVDCIVVKVVVMDRRDGAGEEKVLSRSPSVRGMVLDVPVPDTVVSAVVPNVGALDFGWLCASCERVVEFFLRESELYRDGGSDKGAE